jgi:hypothetical protein
VPHIFQNPLFAAFPQSRLCRELNRLKTPNTGCSSRSGTKCGVSWSSCLDFSAMCPLTVCTRVCMFRHLGHKILARLSSPTRCMSGLSCLVYIRYPMVNRALCCSVQPASVVPEVILLRLSHRALICCLSPALYAVRRHHASNSRSGTFHWGNIRVFVMGSSCRWL